MRHQFHVERAMDYRLLRIDGHGLIDQTLTISLSDDDIAMAWGRMLGCGCTVQVWRGPTCVATILPGPGYYGSIPVVHG